MQALNESNKITYNYKIKIFLIQLILSLAYFLIYFTINLVFGSENYDLINMLQYGYPIEMIISAAFSTTSLIGSILTFLLSIIYYVIEFGTKASIYKFLNEKN